jgi:predicted phage tail protein
MNYRSPYERRLGTLRLIRRGALLGALLVVSLWLDGPAYRLLAVTYEPTTELTTNQHESTEENTRTTPAQRKARLESKDWYQMFRAAGYLPTWLLIGGAVWLVDRRLGRLHSGGAAMIVGAAGAGLVAEILKPILGRHRPALDGSLDWNPLFGGLLQPDTYGHSLGLPSSHTAVAFGAAFVIARMYPGAGLVAVFAATGCAFTRLAAGAHVLSDVVVAALLAGLLSSLIARSMTDPESRTKRLMRFD